MSILVRIDLLAGRYHAHTWGEAQFAMAGPEWPPSPWRLLRALAASWFESSPRVCNENDRDQLLDALGRSGPPTIWIPRVSFQEVPFYQPIMGEKGPKRVLHFDHFAILAGDPSGGVGFCFEFHADLATEQRTRLRLLLQHLRYFGRAESRAQLSLVDVGGKPSDGLRATRPATSAISNEARRRVLIPAHDEFRATSLWSLDPGGEVAEHLVEAQIKRARRLPQGARWLEYEVPRSLITHELPASRSRPSLPMPRVSSVRFRAFRRVPIHLGDVVALSRDLRDQAVRTYEGLAAGRTSLRLSGRNANRSVSRDHAHAFYLPIPNAETSHVGDIVVTIPGGEAGIEAEELTALLAVTTLWRRDRHPILVVPEEIGPTAPVSPRAHIWRSRTPFLAPLHFKRGRGQTDVASQLIRVLYEVCGRKPTVVTIGGPAGCGRVTPVRAHLYAGSGNGWRWTRRAAQWFEARFDEPVNIPRPVGAEAHFGLGQFMPAPEK